MHLKGIFIYEASALLVAGKGGHLCQILIMNR